MKFPFINAQKEDRYFVDATLFNIHDLILISTAIECFLFSLILAIKKPSRRLENIFILMLLARAVICLHEVTFWGRDLQTIVVDISPNLFFIGNIGYYIEGPLLLLFVWTLLGKAPTRRTMILLLVLPVFTYLAYITFNFYSLDQQSKRLLIESRDIAYTWHFLLVDILGKGLRSAISVLCIFAIRKQLKEVNHHVSSQFLLFLVTFSCILAWELLLDGVKILGIWVDVPVDLLVFMGVSSYYAMFLFLNFLIFSNINLDITADTVLEAGPSSDEEPKTSPKPVERVHHEPDEIDKKVLQHIDKGIEEKRLYALSDLTLEKLAAELELPPKTLSLAINRYREMNFYEFINNYRADAAKSLLERAPVNGKYEQSVTDILHQVGFNSKSVFNTFFKKKFGMTPTQHRKNFQHSTSDTQK